MTRLGLDIGGTKLCAAAVTGVGTVVVSRTAPTPAQDGPTAILDAAAALVRAVAAEAGVATDHLGVGTAGVVDRRGGTIVSATSALRGWAGTDVRAGLSSRLGGTRIEVVNDVHAFALGEASLGVGRGAASVLAVALGTGVGGAFVGPDAHLLTGAHHVAGHIGHLTVPAAVGLPCPCGRTGHLEAVASGPAVVQRYRHAGGSARTGHDVAAALADGDLRAAEVVRVAGQSLGIALASATALVDPAVIVVGGGALGIGPSLLAAAQTAYQNVALPILAEVPIRLAALELPVAVGAATLIPEGER